MPRRKDLTDSEEDEAQRTSSEEVARRPKKQAASRKSSQKRKNDDNDEVIKPQQNKQTAKKPKTVTVKKPIIADIADEHDDQEEQEGQDQGVAINVDAQGDRYIDLGKKRRATVRSFKGIILLDLREYYGQEGDLQPGKKGITLQKEQWDILRNNADAIDKLFDRLKK